MSEPCHQEENIGAFKNFMERVCNVKFSVNSHLSNIRANGGKIIGIGAATKGNTFLNFADVQLDVIIDDNELKQGMYTPGTRIPITSINALANYTNNDKIMFVPLAWNFFNEIKRRILAVRQNENDRFMCYFPEFSISA